MLLFYSSLPLVVQAVLILFLGRQLWHEYFHQNPCSGIAELIYQNKQWTLIYGNGQRVPCDEIKIVIQNNLFQLIQCSSPQKNKLIILFNDQIPDDQLRLLHLLTPKISL